MPGTCRIASSGAILRSNDGGAPFFDVEGGTLHARVGGADDTAPTTTGRRFSGLPAQPPSTDVGIYLAEDSLVCEREVEEEEETPSSSATSASMIVEAHPVQRRRQLLLVSISILIVGVIIVGRAVGVTTGRTRGPEESGRTLRPSAPPTLAPTAAPTTPLDRDFRAVLPTPTLEAVLTDPKSPQSKAYQWAMEDASGLWTQDLDSSEVHLNCMTQRFALATFFFAAGGHKVDRWTNRSDWLDSERSECEWFGCWWNGVSVQWLDLRMNDLTGTIPLELELLQSSLGSLYLSANAISRRLPTVFGRLTALMDVDLTENLLSGTIPTELRFLSGLQ